MVGDEWRWFHSMKQYLGNKEQNNQSEQSFFLFFLFYLILLVYYVDYPIKDKFKFKLVFLFDDKKKQWS